VINVLIVDDDAMVAELNRVYTTRLSGFTCCGVASTLRQAENMINDPALDIDLILLDVYMQQDNGLSLLPIIRASGRKIDVIMISSASDAATIQTSMHYGVVDYLIKPFQFPRFEEALTHWREKETDGRAAVLRTGGCGQAAPRRAAGGCRYPALAKGADPADAADHLSVD
jgi:two-component system response regulator DcuR